MTTVTPRNMETILRSFHLDSMLANNTMTALGGMALR